MKFNLITLLPLLAQVSASDKTPFLRGLKSDQGGKPPGYEKAKEAKNKLKDDALGLHGVVGTGIGPMKMVRAISRLRSSSSWNHSQMSPRSLSLSMVSR